MDKIEHSDYCQSQHSPYFDSGCDIDCGYYKQAVAECVSAGEHFRMITSDGGYDVCANCGVRQ